MIDVNFIREAHEHGLKVYPWTVNDESDMVNLLQMEVDGLITDFPRLCMLVISKYGK
ncbi:MAG: glycerophosphodiester phosphodiesterase [Promethearchaeota archaeon]